MAAVRRGFTTLPVEDETDDTVFAGGDYFPTGPEDSPDAEPQPEATQTEGNKHKLISLEDYRRDSPASLVTPGSKKGRNVKRTAHDNDEEESDAEGDIFAGDTHIVANHKTFAHHMKKKLGAHDDFPDPSGKGFIKARRIPAQDDPENHAIKNLRVNEKLSWSDITMLINAERIKKGSVPDLTDAATYSRFVRNAPRIAAQEGDADFDHRDYMHLKPKEMGKLDASIIGGDSSSKTTTSGEVANKGKRKWSRKADEILVSSYKAAKEEFWMVVAEKFELQSGRSISQADCAKRFKLL